MYVLSCGGGHMRFHLDCFYFLTEKQSNELANVHNHLGEGESEKVEICIRITGQN